MLPVANFCARCGAVVARAAVSPPPLSGAAHPGYAGVDADTQLLRQIADYERISAVLWLVLGIVQVISVIAVIAGIWNIIAAVSRFGLVPRIQQRDPGVPAAYEGVTGLVLIGLVNLCLGGMIGVAFVVFDFIIRDKVLSNRHLFDPK